MNEQIEQMADVVFDWLNEATEGNRQQFINCPFDELIMYHSSLGRSIRNHFQLWENQWVPEIENGIDISKQHPDAVSMEVIKRAWEKAHE